jgi:hypothetical protein
LPGGDPFARARVELALDLVYEFEMQRQVATQEIDHE